MVRREARRRWGRVVTHIRIEALPVLGISATKFRMKPPATALLLAILSSTAFAPEPSQPQPVERSGRFQAIALTITPNEDPKRAYSTALRLDTATGEASILVSIDVGERPPTVRTYAWATVGEDMAKELERSNDLWRRLHSAPRQK